MRGRINFKGNNLPVASDGLEGAVVSTEWDVESNDGLAGLDELEVLGVNAGLASSLVEEELDLLEETWLVVLVELWPELLGSSSSVTAGGGGGSGSGESGGLCMHTMRLVRHMGMDLRLMKRELLALRATLESLCIVESIFSF